MIVHPFAAVNPAFARTWSKTPLETTEPSGWMEVLPKLDWSVMGNSVLVQMSSGLFAMATVPAQEGETGMPNAIAHEQTNAAPPTGLRTRSRFMAHFLSQEARAARAALDSFPRSAWGRGTTSRTLPSRPEAGLDPVWQSAILVST